MFEYQTILPPNSTKLEYDLEYIIFKRLDLPIKIKELWNYKTCPEHLLGWLAWTFSVDYWDSGWSEEVKRNVIGTSAQIHRLKGTVFAVKTAISNTGYTATLKEWWQDEPRAQAHTFKIDFNFLDQPVDHPQLDAGAIEQIRVAVNASKPVRSHYAITTSINTSLDLFYATASSFAHSLTEEGELDAGYTMQTAMNLQIAGASNFGLWIEETGDLNVN